MFLKPEDEERLGVSNDVMTKASGAVVGESHPHAATQEGTTVSDTPPAREPGEAGTFVPKPAIRLFIGITCAAFRSERLAGRDRLVSELFAQCAGQRDKVEIYVHNDALGKGSLGPWICLLEKALASDATHFVHLPDDAILVPHFIEVLRNAIAARPEAIICCQSNHEGSPKAYLEGARWYTTPDGATMFGGTMPRDLVRKHLEWRRRAIREGVLVQGDEGVNLWAMATGRKIYKPLPSLVDHDLSMPSVDGNDHHASLSARRPLVWEGDRDLRGLKWDGLAIDLGRTYVGNHWRLAFDVRPDYIDVEPMFTADRHGKPVDLTPHVFIATPAYTPPRLAYLRSVQQTIADLREHGINTTHYVTGGDSLVTRGRHHLVHEFMRSSATHLLQWDSDVECLDSTAVREMLKTGRHIVGGAYPWKDGSGRVVANPLATGVDVPTRIDNQCIRVAEVGTGFMLTDRFVFATLMQAHPELLYQCDFPEMPGAALWALFDTALEMQRDGRMRYASEDWRFCSIARAHGFDVWVYLPPVFRHWADHAHEGHVGKAWGITYPVLTESPK